MSAPKTILKKTILQFTPDFPGLKGVNIMASQYPIEPVLVFTEYRMTQPVFGPHPHAGISVITYMLPDSKESFINRDSNGDFSIIEPGGLHITQAGSGIHHDEFPKVAGNEAHGFQIWINHSEKNRLAEPKAIHANANEIPEIVTTDAKVRILHGVNNNISPSYKMLTDVTLLHIFLKPGAGIELEAKEMAFVYGLSGSGQTNGESVSAQTLINYDAAGNTVSIKAFDNGLELMFATATPLNEPIVYGGPFVMTTAEQMQETKRRYGSGKMGTLEPYNAQ